MQEPDISKLFKSPTYFLVAGSVFGLSAAVFFGQPILAKQLDDWQLLPRPERVTEFYFSDYGDLPASASSGGTQTVEFTVHNLEHRTTSYRYTLLVTSAGSNTEQRVGNGSFALEHGSSLKTSKRITLPQIEGRVAIKVKLEYEGIALGDRAPSAQVQSIHHWTTVAASNGDKGDHEGA